MTRSFLNGASAALGCLLLLISQIGYAATAMAQEPVTIVLQGDEKPEVIARTIEALTRDGKAVTVRLAPATKTADGMGSQVDTFLDRLAVFGDQFVAAYHEGNADLPKIAGLPGNLAERWATNLNGREGPSALMRLFLVIGLAGLVAFGTHGATRSTLAQRCEPEGHLLVQRFKAATFVAVRDVLTIVVFWLVAKLAANILLPQLDPSARLTGIITSAIVTVGAYFAVGRLVLAPGHAERRLLPLPRAERHFRLLVTYAVFGQCALVIAAVAGNVASDKGAASGLFAVVVTVLAIYKIWWFWDMRHDVAALILASSAQNIAPHPARAFLAHAVPWLYISSALVIWIVLRAATVMANGLQWGIAAGNTQILLILIPLCAAGLKALIRSIRSMRAEVVQPSPLRRAIGQALESGIGALAWACGLYLLARIWSDLLIDLNAAEYAAVTRQATVIATVAFFGWTTQTFLRGYFDAYAPGRPVSRPVEEDHPVEEQVPSRLATVLPVLRGLVLGGVVALTCLIIISRLGIDIGPLLAGFGILGLAFSFGSQALVRDIVSGIFYMAEDAFRVGEYVDTGRLKGTVEKISLRSVQLRHQSGQVHTVPFGQIPSLTNASRDWATVKFNLRLDRKVDIEKARKVIKKVGVAMQENPEIAPHLIAPLKMQGVADIADNAIVVRLKFTAVPAHASVVQREAMKKVYSALSEAGIPFASNAVTVRSPDERLAAAALASQTVPPQRAVG